MSKHVVVSREKRDEWLERAAYAEVHLELFEQLLCAMAFDKGVLCESYDRLVGRPRCGAGSMDLDGLFGLPSPGISAVEAQPAKLIHPSTSIAR